MNINYNGSATSGTRISDIAAGDSFIFTSAKNDANSGLSVRVKDSKAGKARFVNLESGKLLTASDGDTGRVVDTYVEVDA